MHRNPPPPALHPPHWMPPLCYLAVICAQQHVSTCTERCLRWRYWRYAGAVGNAAANRHHLLCAECVCVRCVHLCVGEGYSGEGDSVKNLHTVYGVFVCVCVCARENLRAVCTLCV